MRGGEIMNKGVKKLIESRKKLNLTQEELSEKTSINRNTIASIEAGINRPSIATAKVLAKFLNFDWTLFYEEE